MSSGSYITPAHTSVKVPGSLNHVGAEIFGDEYFGENNSNVFFMNDMINLRLYVTQL